MTPSRRTEFLKIALIVGVAFVLLFFIAPGLQDSPYNDF